MNEFDRPSRVYHGYQRILGQFILVEQMEKISKGEEARPDEMYSKIINKCLLDIINGLSHNRVTHDPNLLATDIMGHLTSLDLYDHSPQSLDSCYRGLLLSMREIGGFIDTWEKYNEMDWGY